MKTLLTNLYRDDAGFIVSAELILVSTIAVLSMVVGLSEVASAVNQELEDVASAFGSINQSFRYSGWDCQDGSFFDDEQDNCDSQYDIVAADPAGEGDGW